jgi:hypothetical protein
MCRDLFKAFFLVILALVAGLTANVALIKYRAFESSIYKEHLIKNNVYRIVSDEVKTGIQKGDSSSEGQLPPVINESGEFDPSALVMQSLIARALGPEDLQKVVEKMLDMSFDYVKGKRENVDFTAIATEAINDNSDNGGLFGKVENDVKKLLQDIPSCEATGASENCLPDEYAEFKDFNIQDFIQKQVAENPNISFDGEKISFNEETPANEPPTDIQYNKSYGTLSLLREVYNL